MEIVGALFETAIDAGCVASFHPSRPSTSVLVANAESLYRDFYGKPSGYASLSGDTLVHSQLEPPQHLTDPHRLKSAFTALRSSSYSPERARARAEAVTLMRDKVNPTYRHAKLALQHVERKIAKREKRIDRHGAAAELETHQLTQLHDAKQLLSNLKRDLALHKREFAALDGQQQLFTSGERFRRNTLNAAHMMFRAFDRHRVAVYSVIGTLLTLACLQSILQSTRTSRQK